MPTWTPVHQHHQTADQSMPFTNFSKSSGKRTAQAVYILCFPWYPRKLSKWTNRDDGEKDLFVPKRYEDTGQVLAGLWYRNGRETEWKSCTAHIAFHEQWSQEYFFSGGAEKLERINQMRIFTADLLLARRWNIRPRGTYIPLSSPAEACRWWKLTCSLWIRCPGEKPYPAEWSISRFLVASTFLQ